jgi:hypothetical protein
MDDDQYNEGPTAAMLEGFTELTVKSSALELLAQAVLDGRVSFEQRTSRTGGISRTRIKVLRAEEVDD